MADASIPEPRLDLGQSRDPRQPKWWLSPRDYDIGMLLGELNGGVSGFGRYFEQTGIEVRT